MLKGLVHAISSIPRILADRLRLWWSRDLFGAPDPASSKHGIGFWFCLFAVACIAGIALFPKLGYPLVEPDEGRYAEIGREMLRGGDWLVPKMSARPYYDKPPLTYWLVAASLRCFGIHAWAARLVPALAAFVMVLAAFWFGCRNFGMRVGFLSALALSLMVGLVLGGRLVITDGVLALCEALSLWTAFEALKGPRFQWHWWACSAVFCALGLLTKGPIAFLTIVGPLSAFRWLDKDRVRVRLVHWAVFVGLAGFLAAPWFVVMTIKEPGFARLFFYEHHVMRYFGPEFHEEPIWFYIPVLLVGCLPWSVLLFPMSWSLFSRSPVMAGQRPRALGFSLLWVGWCLLFFSLSRGKLPTYILPAIPAIAVLIGWYLDLILFRLPENAFFRAARGHAARLTALILGLTWVIGNYWAWKMGFLGAHGYRWLIPGGMVALACFAGVLRWGSRMQPKVAWGLCAVFGFFLTVEVSQGIVPAWSSRRSPVAGVKALLEDRQMAAVCDGEEWGSVPFQLDHDGNFFLTDARTPEELSSFLSGNSRSLLFVKPDQGLGLKGWTAPPGLEIAAVFPSGKAQVLLIRKIATGAKNN